MTDVYKNDPVLLEWCQELLIKGKFEDAENFAHVLREAKDHPSLLMLARALDANGKSKKATKLLKEQIEKTMGTVGPEIFEAWSATLGHLDVLQWAHESGCPWDETTCSGAARRGHLEVLQWARAHGCPWDHETLTQAASCGHMFVVEWAEAYGCPSRQRSVQKQEAAFDA